MGLELREAPLFTVLETLMSNAAFAARELMIWWDLDNPQEVLDKDAEGKNKVLPIRHVAFTTFDVQYGSDLEGKLLNAIPKTYKSAKGVIVRPFGVFQSSYNSSIYLEKYMVRVVTWGDDTP